MSTARSWAIMATLHHIPTHCIPCPLVFAAPIALARICRTVSLSSLRDKLFEAELHFPVMSEHS